MSDLVGGAVRRALFSDMPPGLAASWAGRHARVPNVFFEQLLDMGFPDWLCVQHCCPPYALVVFDALCFADA